MTDDIPVLVVDMTTLRFRTRATGGPVAVTTRTGQLLATVHPRKGESQQSIAFRGMDAALATARLPLPQTGPGTPRFGPVALYNPFTGDVSFGAIPDTVTFSSGTPVPLDADGTLGVVTPGCVPVLQVCGRHLPATDRTVTELTRVIAGHCA
jgi:hypothetical protein